MVAQEQALLRAIRLHPSQQLFSTAYTSLLRDTGSFSTYLPTPACYNKQELFIIIFSLPWGSFYQMGREYKKYFLPVLRIHGVFVRIRIRFYFGVVSDPRIRILISFFFFDFMCRSVRSHHAWVPVGTVSFILILELWQFFVEIILLDGPGSVNKMQIRIRGNDVDPDPQHWFVQCKSNAYGTVPTAERSNCQIRTNVPVRHWKEKDPVWKG